MDKFLEKYNFPKLDQEEIENLNSTLILKRQNLEGRLQYPLHSPS